MILIVTDSACRCTTPSPAHAGEATPVGADAPEAESPGAHPESLADWPADLIDPMRDAVITADLDQLLARIQDAEARDPAVARGLRRLAEGFQYQKLLDLFSAPTAR